MDAGGLGGKIVLTPWAPLPGDLQASVARAADRPTVEASSTESPKGCRDGGLAAVTHTTG